MRLRAETRRHLIVASTFAVIVGIGIALGYWQESRDWESPLRACTRKCAAVYRSGRLVYEGPDTPQTAYKEAHSVCKCEQP